ncbi:MAG: SDR family NAD(P)-dependent oxidoreductase, partial [Mycobacteriales bacterium]
RVVLLGRDGLRTTAAAERVRAAVPGAQAEAVVCDVSSLASLAAFTSSWTGPLDVLVNNAGVMPPSRELTGEGIELTFATNVLGPFVLTDRLSRRLPPGGRVINVTSGGMYGQRLDGDLQNVDYTPVKAYARTKRAEVVLTELWAERLRDQGVVVHAMHPGWADTPGVQSSLSRFAKVMRPILRTPEQGADTIVWLGAAPEALASTGRLWHDRRERPTYLFGLNREPEQSRQALWDTCVELSAG